MALSFLYYFFLEVTPVLTIALFFLSNSKKTGYLPNSGTTPNNNNNQENQRIEPPDFTYGTWEPTRKLVNSYENGGAPPELVDEILAKMLAYSESFN